MSARVAVFGACALLVAIALARPVRAGELDLDEAPSPDGSPIVVNGHAFRVEATPEAIVARAEDARPFFVFAGDAPGDDSVYAGRPSASRRVVAARAIGRGYVLRVYESERAPEELVSELADRLRERGFVRATSRNGGATFFRDAIDVIVHARRDGDRSLLSVLEVGTR